jgi:formylglycine-generating enzyme
MTQAGSDAQLHATVWMLLCLFGFASSVAAAERPRSQRGCPSEMARVGHFCVDRWESSSIDKVTRQELSPYYPPHRVLMNRVLDVWQIERASWGAEPARAFLLPELSRFQRDGRFSAVARSVPNVVPQAYLSRELARKLCESGGKRLCSHAEWQMACRGERGTLFPYGSEYVAGRCNVWRNTHPARVLHGNSSLGHLDPRLNLVVEFDDGALLRPTGTSAACVSRFGDDFIYDMVGNLDEWVDDESGTFAGGFYARPSNKGCEAKVSSHSPTYYDYSTGARCCRDAAAVSAR